MNFFLLALIVIIFIGLRICTGNSFNESYLDKKSTTAINGIFVVLVVFSHYAQYADFGGTYDDVYLMIREHLNQMVVAPFMFYSGYGMMEAIKRKGEAYIKGIPGKFIKLLLRFDIAVVLFWILNFAIGVRYSASQVALALTTWTSIGNSNWYITAILILYVCMFISFSVSFRLFKGRPGRISGIVLFFILTAAVVYLQILIERPAYCYNTMILLPLGCLFSEARQSVEQRVTKNTLTYLLIAAAVVVIYYYSYIHRWDHGIWVYTIWAFSFVAVMLLITMKIRIYNPVLEWLGKHVFSIYILQRIPMILLNYFGCIGQHKYISLAAVIALTLPLALVFDKATDRLLGGSRNTRKEGKSING